jgi:hypothetical protein
MIKIIKRDFPDDVDDVCGCDGCCGSLSNIIYWKEDKCKQDKNS